MRTKTLLLAAFAGVAGLSSASAQTVYSQNAVGYVNLTFPAGQYKLICNPLNATNNTIAGVFSSIPDGSNLFKWTGTGFTTATFASFLGGWDQPSITLNPGEGAFILAGATFTNTFVGQVMQGSLSNNIPVGYSVKSSQVPQAAGVDVLGFTVNDGDNLFQWTGSGYTTFTYASFLGGWNPSIPQVGVGESVFLLTASGGSIVRNFSIAN